MITGIIYMYISPSGKLYIGQTVNERKRRLMWFSIKRPYTKWSSKIDNARAKYGPENFRYIILHKGLYNNIEDAKSELNNLEILHIREYDSFHNGYNSTIGGDSTIGYVHTEETRRKISNVHKGKKLSSEQKSFLKELHTGRKLSEESKKKIGDAHRGIKFSDDARANISKALTGRKLSEEARLNISKGHKGIRRSKESIEKSSAANMKVVEAYSNGVLIHTFNSLKEAANFIGKSPSTLSVVCKNNKLYYGYTWKYNNG